MTPAPHIPNAFTIHVGASIDPGWTDWLDGAHIVGAEDGTGLITTVGCDQAMLIGLLTRICDLGIPLIGVYPGSAIGRTAVPTQARPPRRPYEKGSS